MHVNVSALKRECSEGIEAITLLDMDEIVRLHCEYLNYGEGVRPHLELALNAESTIALKYVVDGEMAGVVIYTEGIALSGGHFDLCNEMEKLTGGQLTYTGDALFVKKEFQHMGICDKLYNTLKKELNSRNVKFAVNELWVYADGTVPAREVLRVFGEIVYHKKCENFYKDFYNYGYICPICGKDCICSAQVYLSEVIKLRRLL